MKYISFHTDAAIGAAVHHGLKSEWSGVLSRFKRSASWYWKVLLWLFNWFYFGGFRV